MKPDPIPADKDEVPITLTVPAQAPAGWKVNVILNGTHVDRQRDRHADRPRHPHQDPAGKVAGLVILAFGDS